MILKIMREREREKEIGLCELKREGKHFAEMADRGCQGGGQSEEAGVKEGQ